MARTSIQEIFASFASFPTVGGSNILYIATDTDTLYRWNGSSYVAIGGGTATTATNLAGGAGGSIPYQSSAGVTAMLANGTAGYLLQSNGTTLAPSWVAAPAGFSWGSSITGTTGTGSLLTMGDSYAAGGIGQSIVLGNTQTLAQTGFKIDMGTTTVTANVAEDITILNGFGLKINSGNASNLVQQTIGIDIGGASFNTNSARSFAGINMILANNAGTGFNGGIGIDYRSSDAYSVGNSLPAQPAIYINYNTGNGGTPFAIYGGSNINTSTNGLVNFTLGNTQSGATVMQKISTGTSAQGNIAYNATVANGSTSAVAYQASMGNGTGKGFEYTCTNAGNYWEQIDVGSTADYAFRSFNNDNSKDLGFLSANNATIHNVNRKAFVTVSDGITRNGSTAQTTDIFSFSFSDQTVGSITQTSSQNVFYISDLAWSNSGATRTFTGAALCVERNVNANTGTINDSRVVLKLIQDADSTGLPVSITQNAVVTTNFRKVIGETATGINIWFSNGTDPNGSLSGTAGDICLNGATNKPAYCTGTTVWVNFV